MPDMQKLIVDDDHFSYMNTSVARLPPLTAVVHMHSFKDLITLRCFQFLSQRVQIDVHCGFISMLH